MTRFLGLVAIALAACGDNRVPCGDGTTEVDGRCVAPVPIACGPGTQLTDGACVVEDAICDAGTVLIAERCVDPARELTIDLEESAEPNGAGIAAGVEASPASAGVIAPKPAGMPFVVHGHLTPFRDADGDGQLDPDVDTYELAVRAPTLLEISVDGVGGALGAFYATAVLAPTGGRPAQRYERYGLALAGDTARRRLFLPAAGSYRLAITDLRALAIGNHPPPAAGKGGAAGGPDAEYYAAITVEELPAPAAIALTAGTGHAAGQLGADDVAFFTAALGATARIDDAMPGAALAAVSITLGTDADAPVAGYAEETAGTASAMFVTAGGGGPPLIAADAVYNTGPAPEPFSLTVTVP
ncbi:MAG TPA: hypothetical protein VGC42_26100 [Kofleriaceae bacterium]